MGSFRGGDPEEVGKLGGRPRGSKNKPEPDPLEGLNEKKKKYALLLAKGHSKREAALRAGYTIAMANAACQKIETGDFKQRFADLVRKKIPASKIIKRINAGLDATDTKFFSKDGVVTDSRDVVNWAERRKTAELAAQMGDLWHPRQAFKQLRHSMTPHCAGCLILRIS